MARADTSWCCDCPTISAARSPQDQARTLIDTPAGRIPVSSIATLEETDGPNPIGRENGRRRIIEYANTDGGDMGRVIKVIRNIIDKTPLPPGNFVSLEGQSWPTCRWR